MPGRSKKMYGISPWLGVIVVVMWSFVAMEWGCYGTYPGPYKPDSGQSSEAKAEPPAADRDAGGVETPAKDDAQEPSVRPEPLAPDEPSQQDQPGQESAPDQPPSEPQPDTPQTPEEPAPRDQPAPRDATPEQPQDRAMPPANRCLQSKPPQPSGQTLTLSPGKTLKALLGQAKGGDRIVVKQGTYPKETLQGITFNDYVTIEAEAGAKPVFEGIEWRSSAYIAFVGIHIRKQALSFRDCHHIWIDSVDVDLGTISSSGIQIVGTGGGPTSHHFEIHNSRIVGGQRTIFMRTNFSPDANWNHEIKLTYNHIECGSNVCIQLSGVRDMLIQNNTFKSSRGTAILLAGATKIEIRRNHVEGDRSVSGYKSGMNIATPGKEWDNFKNVKYMITSAVTIANNLVFNWTGNGITLNGTHHIDIVNNTIYNNKSTALHFARRTPHDYDGNLILTGNKDIRLWNNIMDKMSLASGEPRPTLESNNLVENGGGGGSGLIKAAPMFQSATDYSLKPASPAVDKGLVNKDTPQHDLHNTQRDNKPDIGAIEVGSTAASCP